jgi:glycosyltransferase involved in cell wall biosynthesis
MSPLHVGIVIPAHNAEGWIDRCLRSLLEQTHRAWSAVVVDDGSVDRTASEAAQFHDDRIRLIRQPNAGVSAARNRALQELSGCGAIVFLDADDWLAPDALRRLAGAFREAPEAVAAVGPAVFVHPDGSVTCLRRPPHGDILQRLLRGNVFANGGHLLIRRDAVRRAGPFDPALRFGEDWEYWIRLALLGSFVAAAGSGPVLFVRRLDRGAYRRLAGDPASFQPCMDAIFGNPVLRARVGEERLTRLRSRTEAENAWITGRALISRNAVAEGRAFLRRSLVRAPSPKRLALLAATYFPPAWRLLGA